MLKMREEQKTKYNADEGLKGVFSMVCNRFLLHIVKYESIDLYNIQI
jgi:hypothetical protein